MPAAPAIVTAIGVIGSAYLAKRGNDNARNAQTKANDQAIAFEREQEAKYEGEKAKKHQAYLAYLKVKNPDMYNSLIAAEGGAAAAAPAGPTGRADLKRVNPNALMAEYGIGALGDAARAGLAAPAGGPVPEGGFGAGRTLGEMIGGTPRVAALDQSTMPAPGVTPELMAPGQLPGPDAQGAPGAPATGLAGLGDYDWRRGITRPRASMGGRHGTA